MNLQSHKEYFKNIKTHISRWDKLKLELLVGLLPRMESLERSLSIVIQGPLNKRIKESIPHYLDLVKKNQHFLKKLENNHYSQEKTLGNIVISYWDNDDESIISDYKNNPNIILVKNDSSMYNIQNKNHHSKNKRGAAPWILQNVTTLEGLKHCTGNMSIKVRSDEIYPSLNIFHDAMFKKYGTFFTSDIFFRRDDHEKFHISDHIIGNTTKKMQSAFQESLKMCINNNKDNNRFPEQLICKGILKSLNIDYSKEWKSKQIMKDNFSIIPISSMPNSIWTCSYRGYEALRQNEGNWVQDIKNI